MSLKSSGLALCLETSALDTLRNGQESSIVTTIDFSSHPSILVTLNLVG